MKKFIAIMISVMIFVSLFAGLQISAEAPAEEIKVTNTFDRFNGSTGPAKDCTFIQGQASAIEILGWVITDKGISNVKYAIDDGEAVELTPTRPRSDVLDAINYAGPELANADKVGIGEDNDHAKIDISALAVGEHNVKLYVYTNDGTEVEFASFKVTILAPLAEGEIIDLDSITEPGEYKLVADVTGGISLSSGVYVIDLNGHTWTNSGIALDVAGADVTIIDSVGDGYIMATANDCINVNAGKVTVTEATAIATADGMDAIFVGGGTVVVNDAILFAGKAGINAANAGIDITINGATFNGVYSVSGEPFARTAAIEFRNNATVKVGGEIYFSVDRIIRRANHTISWEESFITADGSYIYFDYEDTDIGNHGGNQYYSNAVYYEYIIPAVVGITPHSGHHGNPVMWLKAEDPNNYYEMIISAEGAFNAIISSLWASNDGTTCILDIYEWNSDRDTTLAGEPIVSVTESFTGNPSNYVFEFEEIYGGQYIIVIRCTEGYLVLPVADDVIEGAEVKVSTKNTNNLSDKYWVASFRFIDSDFATFGTLMPDAGESPEAPLLIFGVEGIAKVKPDKTYYVGGFWSGMGITITGEGNFKVIYDNETLVAENGVVKFTAKTTMGRMPTIFAIVNETDETVEYKIEAEYPVGDYMNPEEFDPADKDEKTVDLPEGDEEGYFYSFVATEDGSIILHISSVSNNAVANMIVTVTGEDFMSDVKYLSEDADNGKLTINYKAGDEVIINVFVEPDDNWTFPAATVVFGQYVEPSATGDFGLIALAFVAISSVVLKKKKEY